MDARFMGKRIGPHDGFVGLNHDTGNHAYQATGRMDILGVNACNGGKNILPGVQRHNDFLQGSVAGPLTDAVDGYFRLTGPGLDGGDGVGGCQSQIIVAMHAKDSLMNVGGMADDIAYQIRKFFRYGITHRVRKINGGGAGFNGSLEYPAQEIAVAARSVFGGKLNIVGQGFGILNGLHGCFDNLIPGHFQFVFQMDI